MMYSLVSIIALFVTVAINFDFLFNRSYKARDHHVFRAYRMLIASASLYFIFDFLWGILDAYAPVIWVEIDTSFYFASMGLFLFAWYYFVSRYVIERKPIRIILVVLGSLFLASGIVLVGINFAHPILFSYSDVYITGRARDVYLSAQITMFGLIAIIAFVATFVHKHERKLRFAAIAISALIMGGALIFQFYFPLYPFYAMGCLALISLVHAFVALAEKEDYRNSIQSALAREKTQNERLNIIEEIAYTDSLTGAKSKHSYVELETKIDALIREKKAAEFCLLLFDLNNLKNINDTYGHETGDKYIIKSCDIIRRFLPGEEIFRYGGDEFVVILRGKAYEKRYEILEKFNAYIDANIHTSEPIISAGFSDFVPEQDNTLSAVFARADERMYHRKKILKGAALSTGVSGPSIENQPFLNTRELLYENFYHSSQFTLVDMLNGSNCDELIEVDTQNDSYRQIYHVAGKYSVPMTDGTFSELRDFAAKHVVHPDDLGIYMGLMKEEGFFERLASAKIPNFDFAHFRYKLQGGEYRYVEQVILTGKENGFKPGCFRIYLFDINNIMSRKLGIVSDENNVISLGRDQLTGLLTGKEFFLKAGEVVKANPDVRWCVVVIDIEHFKFFSEWFGRKKGDILLASLGAELVGEEGNCHGVGGYFGSDDFAMLMPFDKPAIEAMYGKIKEAIHSFDLTGGLLPALGVSEIGNDGTVLDAFDHASFAVAKAKEDIASRICYYNGDMRYLAEQEYRILTSFANALQHDEITFYLQPQCRISTGAIVGAEALVRWVRKDGSMVFPSDFVPVLEKYGFITDLDQFLWDKVCQWIASMREKKKDAIVPISINVSRVDVLNLDLSTHFHDLCAKYSIPHSLLKIEITESSYAETTAEIDELVRKLRADGFFVMMDDFGSGFSSLNMLSTLRLDAIKMDARFLHLDGKDGDKGVRILESVVNMAKSMALPVIMEGVETKDQTEFLSGLGCRYAQGYYYYKPMPIAEFEGLLANQKNFDHSGIVVKINEQFRLREFLDKNIYSDSMLNNVLGPVAIYYLKGDHVDITRYNEQFYQAVNVPDFAQRLTCIEQFMPEPDRPLLLATLKEAKGNRLLGATATFRFFLTNGTVSFFNIHFYYLGRKEGGDQFYGSAHNVTALLDAVEEKRLISEYSSDNIIFLDKVYGLWNFRVSSNAIATLFGLNTLQLENELNDGSFSKRLVAPKTIKGILTQVEAHAEKGEDFHMDVKVRTKEHGNLLIGLDFVYVKEKASNVTFLLMAKIT